MGRSPGQHGRHPVVADGQFSGVRRAAHRVGACGWSCQAGPGRGGAAGARCTELEAEGLKTDAVGAELPRPASVMRLVLILFAVTSVARGQPDPDAVLARARARVQALASRLEKYVC